MESFLWAIWVVLFVELLGIWVVTERGLRIETWVIAYKAGLFLWACALLFGG